MLRHNSEKFDKEAKTVSKLVDYCSRKIADLNGDAEITPSRSNSIPIHVSSDVDTNNLPYISGTPISSGYGRPKLNSSIIFRYFFTHVSKSLNVPISLSLNA